MKKGISKNHHHSKVVSKRKVKKVHNGIYVSIRHNIKSKTDHQLIIKSFKWSRIGTIIQIADFFIDKLPRVIRFLMSLLGMG